MIYSDHRRSALTLRAGLSCLALLAYLSASCAHKSGTERDDDGTVDASTPREPGPWEMVWSDEFEGEAGTPIDVEKWAHDVGGHGWGNDQLEYNTDRADNASLDGEGHLALVARKEDFGDNAYTSARITTRGRLSQEYGRFEARIKLPTGQGIWPAFWMLGSNFGEVGWPDCGEIDIMEFRGQHESIIRNSIHGPGHSGASNVGFEHVSPGAGLPEGFHTFAVEWEPRHIVWFLDGVKTFEVTPSALPPGGRWVYNHPFFLIMNIAVGGGFVGPPNGNTQFPQTMLVDYVRVYARGEAP